MKEPLAWDEVEPLAKSTFTAPWSYSSNEFALLFAQSAWYCLRSAGLTQHAHQSLVYVRFAVLASVYHDWRESAYEHRPDDEIEAVFDIKPYVNPVAIGQLLGGDVDLEKFENHLDEHGGLRLETALTILVLREYPAVVRALKAGFADEPGRHGTSCLFLALWRSTENPEAHEPGEYPDDEEDDEDEWEMRATDDEILNTVTDEKLKAFQWVQAGCPHDPW